MLLASEAKGRGFDPRQPHHLSSSKLLRFLGITPTALVGVFVSG